MPGQHDYAEDERLIQHPLPEWEEFVIGLLMIVVAIILGVVFEVIRVPW